MEHNKRDPVVPAAWAILIIAGALAVYLAVKYLFVALLPFLIAWSLALAVSPLSRRLSHHTNMPEKLLNAILVIAAMLTTALLLFFGIRRLGSEAMRLVEYVEGHPDIFEELFSIADGEGIFIFEGRDGFGADVMRRLNEAISVFVSDTLGGLLGSLTKIAADLLRRLPGALLFVAVTVIASVYFALDLPRINSAILSLLPRSARESVLSLKQGVVDTALGYLRAYLTITFMVFSMLLVGFLVLRVEYAFILALLFALLDLLPVIGVGLMMIPWSGFCFISGDRWLGTGLLVLFLTITVVRQIAEPKIIGGRLGIHPLLILGSMYVGLGLFGGLGMIFGPLVALAVRGAVGKKGTRHLAKNGNAM